MKKMLIEALLLPLIIGKLRGGKFRNLVDINVRYWWLFTVAGFIEFTASWLRAKEIEPVWQGIDDNVLWIQLITYLIIACILIINIKEKGFAIIALGLFLNFLVIMTNEGRMPVDITSIMNVISVDSINYLKSGKDLTHCLATSTTHFWVLGDIIHLMKPYPLPKSISIGDVFLSFGLFVFIYQTMVQKKAPLADDLARNA